MAARLPDLLFRLLAEGDAPFFPLRKHQWEKKELPGVYAEARRRFRDSGGVPWASRERTSTERKRAQRELETLAEAGHIQTTKSGGRTSRVRLTDRTERVVRALIGCGDEQTAYLSMVEIAKRSKRRIEKDILDILVPETAFAGDGFSELLYDAPGGAMCDYLTVTQLMLWALTRDYVRSGSDKYGRVYYHLREAGWRIVDAGKEPTEPDIEPQSEAADLYFAAMAECESRLDNAKPSDPNELGLMPMTCSPMGEKSLYVPQIV